MIATVEPASTSLPALGDWLITSPAGESLSSSETLGVRPRPRICCTARRRWLPTRTGTLASFGPAETTRMTVEPLVAVLPPEGLGVDHQRLLRRCRS